MSESPCAVCGRAPARGFASMWTRDTGEQVYCHDSTDDQDEASCYEQAQWRHYHGLED
jgi:hypothetical protein